MSSLFLLSCRKDQVERELFDVPEHFPSPHFTFENFDLTQERIDLGKKLFEDPILSSDNSIACVSCHVQDYGFSDAGEKYSLGVNDSLSLRNSPGLANLAWNTSFFWDGGVNHLEVTSFAPITNPREMNEDMGNVMTKINANQEYKDLFYSAFNSDSATDQQTLWALSAYMATMISSNSKYDKVYQGLTSFTVEEEKGYSLFKRDCIVCHAEPLTTNNSFENNGLTNAFTDIGRERITLDPNDRGKFKVPSLRNVALTSPYMHDGRYNSLKQVVIHYSEGIVQSSTLSPELGNGFYYTQEEQDALVAFLYTLTDFEFITDPDL